MRRFSNLSGILTALILAVLIAQPVNGQEKKSLKEKIISQRIEKETEELEYAVKVASQEHEIVEKLALNALLKKKKLKFLIRCSLHMKENFIFFDFNCRQLYSMSLVYLKSELKKSTEEVSRMEKQLKESFGRLNQLKDKMERLKKGFVFKKEQSFVKAVIPELKKAYSCIKKGGWNYVRGIFVKPGSIDDMPFPVFIKDIIEMDKGGYMVIVEAGSYDMNFAYVKKPLKEKGEVLKMGERIFEGSTGNPIEPGTVLVFISKDGKFLNPSFMCR